MNMHHLSLMDFLNKTFNVRLNVVERGCLKQVVHVRTHYIEKVNVDEVSHQM